MPTGFFKKVKKGATAMGESFVGPEYNYLEHVKNPSQMGMNDTGNLETLAKDIAGIISYGDILVKGTGNAKIGSKMLGNRFFLNTGSTCKYRGKNVKRYLYVNNTPTGKIPLIPGKSAYFKGLLPGMVENMGALNPMGLMGGLAQTGPPDCTLLEAPVTSRDGRSESMQRHHVAIMDIPVAGPAKRKALNMPPNHRFLDGGGATAVRRANAEGFENLSDALYGEPFKQHYSKINLYDNPFANFYAAGYSFFLIYLYFQLIKKLN